MAEISAQLVKELRDRTGAGFMECKKALLDTNGDLDAAIKALRESGAVKAGKRAGRTAGEGLIGMVISHGGQRATLVEFNCETDFVARTEGFQQFVKSLAEAVNGLDSLPDGAGAATPGEKILDRPFPATPGHTFREAITELAAKTGENLIFRRFVRFEATDGFVAAYLHPPGKIGVLVQFAAQGGAQAASQPGIAGIAADVAMHVAASSPRYLDEKAVDPAVLEQEKEIAANKARNEGKPEKILPKIVEGMIKKFYQDVCLVDQPFVREPAKTVAQAIAEACKAAGQAIQVKSFVRFQVGEGN